MGKRKHNIRITGEVVPPGSLPRNHLNPFAKMNSIERWDRILWNCALVVADKTQSNDAKTPLCQKSAPPELTG